MRRTPLWIRRAMRAALGTLALATPLAIGRGQEIASRPWADWRTIETPRFLVHFPAPLAPWAADVASRIESVDSAVTRLVGWTPRRRVEVIVDDPYTLSNGFAIPLVDRSVIELWAVPPSPRLDIGDVRTWPEMLAVHEFAHVAHLARPSRNPLTRALGRLLPADVGPIARRTPRWVQEGYATFVEGRVTGSGRPNNAWRAAVLRQWATEGRLPTYAQLSTTGGYRGGSFAYLVGSAYLEWLARRGGDSSLVHVWRRLTARQKRSFDAAFAGVYGETPQYLYDRFVAELTASAMEVERTLTRAGLDTGEMVQRLTWETGDPALSPDGSRVAVVLRSATRPSRIVVWGTKPEPDTAAARRNAKLLARDPEDVPARPIHPPPKRALATLRARGGFGFDQPRFMADGRHVLTVRYTPRGDGTVRPDLYVWDTKDGGVRRVTRGGAITSADPLPDGRAAIATRCAAGRCDLVRVDLASGVVEAVVDGGIDMPWYRPRVSRDGRSVVAAVQRAGRWRVVRVDLATRAVTYVDPDDGANRFDAAWRSPGELVVVSDRGGIANVERLTIGREQVVQLTRVTGAAFAPEPSPDGSLWFLSLHSRGLDVRRIAAPRALEPLVALPPTLVPAIPPRGRTGLALSRTATARPHDYGIGPRGGRWLPGGSTGADGSNGTFAIENADVVGRLGVLAQVTAGDPETWRGGALGVRWSGWRPVLRLEGYVADQRPEAAALDVRLRGGVASLTLDSRYARWAHSLAIGGAAASLREGDLPARTRSLAFARLGGQVRAVGDGWTVGAGAATRGAVGRTAGGSFQRAQGTVALFGRGALPFDATGTIGRVWGTVHPFEQFAVGGAPAPMLDQELLAQRLTMPALPTGTSVGRDLLAYRGGVPFGPFTAYYAGATTTRSADRFTAWHRVWGAEVAFDLDAVPIVRVPASRLLLGVGRSLDAPFARRTRGYASLVWRP